MKAKMTGAPRIISPLLVAVAVHMVSSFVQFSPSRTRTTPELHYRQSELFSTAVNSTLSAPSTTTIVAPVRKGENKIIKRKYTVGKSRRHHQTPVHTNSNNRKNKDIGTKLPTITTEKASPKKKRKRNYKGKRDVKPEEFQWLHWVYKQWKDTSPGDLTDENIIKHMKEAIPRWAKRKSPVPARRAEELLERLVQEAIAGNPLMRTKAATLSDGLCSSPQMLDVTLFNSAMDAYGKIGNPAGVQRILRRMESLRTSGVQDFAHLQPDQFSMSILATAWAKSHSDEAAQKAEGIISYMDLNGLVANTITYNTVLHAIAVGKQCDSAMRAEEMVQRMKVRHEENGEDCKPDVYTYQSLIQAWSRTNVPGSPQEAERILRFMDEEASSGKKNCHRVAPNAYCFTTVIHSWARSSEKNRARQAYQLLKIMTGRYHDAKSEFDRNETKKNKSRYELLKPNVKTFTAVLNACAHPVRKSEREDALEIAKLAMADLSEGTYGEKPNFLSYAAYLAVIATTMEAGPERDAETRKIFNECKMTGNVARIVLEKLYAAASPELLFELIGSQLDDKGQITIPPYWNRYTKGERVGGNSSTQTELNEEDVRSIPKSFRQRLEDVQKSGGKSSIYSELSTPTVVRKGEDEILWSKDEFSWGDEK